MWKGKRRATLSSAAAGQAVKEVLGPIGAAAAPTAAPVSTAEVPAAALPVFGSNCSSSRKYTDSSRRKKSQSKNFSLGQKKKRPISGDNRDFPVSRDGRLWSGDKP